MDKREENTRKKVYEALCSLIAEEGYEKINVSDVLLKADVSRSAFYSHFKSKDDVLASFCDQLFDHVFMSKPTKEHDHDFSKGEFDTKDYLTHLAIHLRDSKSIVKAILTSSGKGIFTNQLAKRSQSVMEGMVYHRELAKDGVPERLQIMQLTDSFVSLLSHWVLMDCLSSPETIIGYFYILHQ